MFSTNPAKKKKKGETASLLHNNWPTQIASPCFEPKFFRVIWDVPQTFSKHITSFSWRGRGHWVSSLTRPTQLGGCLEDHPMTCKWFRSNPPFSFRHKVRFGHLEKVTTPNPESPWGVATTNHGSAMIHPPDRLALARPVPPSRPDRL